MLLLLLSWKEQSGKMLFLLLEGSGAGESFSPPPPVILIRRGGEESRVRGQRCIHHASPEAHQQIEMCIVGLPNGQATGNCPATGPARVNGLPSGQAYECMV